MPPISSAYKTQNDLLRNDTAHNGRGGPHELPIKKMFDRLAYKPIIYGGVFIKIDSFFPANPTAYQVDIKIANKTIFNLVVVF